MDKNLEYYMNLKYPVVISELEDEGESVYKAGIEELPGLVVYAHSFDEVASELNMAKQAWFETALELNRQIREPNDLSEYSGRTTIRMSRSLHKKLAELANTENVSLNTVINQLLERNYLSYKDAGHDDRQDAGQ